ncbi:MAG: glycosyltransferase [Melioribacter sp.]|nr:glycosyltransferase [Melioribacter sp.]
MKITLIGPVYPYRGGISQYHSQLAKALIDNNHEVQIISFKRQYPIWLYPGKTDKDPSPPIVSIEAIFILDPINPITWFSTIKKVRKFKPDKIIIQWWTTFWAPAYAFIAYALRKRFSISYLIHNVFPHERRFFDSFFAKFALNPADSFIVLTSREKERLRLFIRSAKDIEVCSIPPNTMLNHFRISKNEARKQLNLDIDIPVILFFGLVRPYKGLKYLIDAIHLLKIQGFTTIKLVIAGEFWEDPEIYYNQIKKLGLNNNAIIHNRYISNEELAKFLSAADLFVAPYIGGTQSGTIKLAMGFNLPIIATDEISADLREIDYPNLVVIPAKNPKALRDAICSVISQTGDLAEELLPQPNNEWQEFISRLEKVSNNLRLKKQGE